MEFLVVWECQCSPLNLFVMYLSTVVVTGSYESRHSELKKIAVCHISFFFFLLTILGLNTNMLLICS